MRTSAHALALVGSALSVAAALSPAPGRAQVDLGDEDVGAGIPAPAPHRAAALEAEGVLEGFPAPAAVRVTAGQEIFVEFSCDAKCRPSVSLNGAGFVHELSDHDEKKQTSILRKAPASGVVVIQIASFDPEGLKTPAELAERFMGLYTFRVRVDGQDAALLPPGTPASTDAAVPAQPTAASGAGSATVPTADTTSPQGAPSPLSDALPALGAADAGGVGFTARGDGALPLCAFVGALERDTLHAYAAYQGAALDAGRFRSTLQLEGGSCEVDRTGGLYCGLDSGSLGELHDPGYAWVDRLKACDFGGRSVFVAPLDPWRHGAPQDIPLFSALGGGTIELRTELRGEGRAQLVLSFK